MTNTELELRIEQRDQIIADLLARNADLQRQLLNTPSVYASPVYYRIGPYGE